MPYFVFRGIDRPDAQALRSQLRERHRSYIRQAAVDCKVVLGGPLLGEADEQMFGTLLVLEASTRDAVLRFLAADPYAQASLFASVAVDRWHWGLGQPGSSAAPHLE